MNNPFRCFNSSPEVIRLAVMLYIRYPLSLRQVEDILFERGIDICHETIRYWWNLFGPMFAAEIRKRRVNARVYSNWRWHLNEVFVRINGQHHYLWRAVDHEGEVLEAFVTRRRDRRAALKFFKRTMSGIWVFTNGYHCLARMDNNRTARSAAELAELAPEEQVAHYEQLLNYSGTAGTYQIEGDTLRRQWDVSLGPDIIGMESVAKVRGGGRPDVRGPAAAHRGVRARGAGDLSPAGIGSGATWPYPRKEPS